MLQGYCIVFQHEQYNEKNHFSSTAGSNHQRVAPQNRCFKNFRKTLEKWMLKVLIFGKVTS